MKLQNEVLLLLLTAGGSGADERIRAVCQASLDWPAFLDVVHREGAQPVVARRLRAADAQLPDPVAQSLAGTERKAELRMVYVRNRLADAVGALSAEGIRVLLLKGAAMAVTTHGGNFGERPMSDVDLLVRGADAQRAHRVLLGDRWTAQYPGAPDELYAAMHHLAPLTDAAAPHLMVGLELHTDIVPPVHNPFAFRAEDLWRTAQPATEFPPDVYVPGAVERLLHCCIHFAWSHMFGSAAWRTFRDIDALANEGLIDWADFLQMAHQARAESACYWTLRLAYDVSGVVVPGEVLTSLRARVRPHAHRLIEQHLAQELTAPQQGCPSYRLRRWLWEAAMRPGASGHGHRRPWHVGDDASWAQLERGDKSEPQRFRGGRVRRAGAAVRYLAGSALAARREV